ncbi:MAG: EVE domain-containing protein [Dehalococcoidia bacterium]
MPKRYWLFKSEPGAYSYDDLERDGVAEWDGVRNYQARNLLRDEIKPGDEVLFYHSSANPNAVIGTAIVVKGGYPDHTAWDPKSAHPDPKSAPESPVWYMVDIEAGRRFARPVALGDMRLSPRLAGMMLLKRGVRLSVQPVTRQEFDAVCAMGWGG